MANIDDIPQLITIDQLADRLGVTERYVRRLTPRNGCHTETSASSSASPSTKSPPGSTPPAGRKGYVTTALDPRRRFEDQGELLSRRAAVPVHDVVAAVA